MRSEINEIKTNNDHRPDNLFKDELNVRHNITKNTFKENKVHVSNETHNTNTSTEVTHETKALASTATRSATALNLVKVSTIAVSVVAVSTVVPGITILPDNLRVSRMNIYQESTSLSYEVEFENYNASSDSITVVLYNSFETLKSEPMFEDHFAFGFFEGLRPEMYYTLAIRNNNILVKSQQVKMPKQEIEVISYAINYHLDGGVNNANNPASYVEGDTVNLADPSREGYKFLGWYTDSDLTQKVTSVDTSLLLPVDLYASWEMLIPELVSLDWSETVTGDTLEFTVDISNVANAECYTVYLMSGGDMISDPYEFSPQEINGTHQIELFHMADYAETLSIELEVTISNEQEDYRFLGRSEDIPVVLSKVTDLYYDPYFYDARLDYREYGIILNVRDDLEKWGSFSVELYEDGSEEVCYSVDVSKEQLGETVIFTDSSNFIFTKATASIRVIGYNGDDQEIIYDDKDVIIPFTSRIVMMEAPEEISGVYKFTPTVLNTAGYITSVTAMIADGEGNVLVSETYSPDQFDGLTEFELDPGDLEGYQMLDFYINAEYDYGDPEQSGGHYIELPATIWSQSLMVN